MRRVGDESKAPVEVPQVPEDGTPMTPLVDGGPAFPCSTEIPVALNPGAARNGFRIRDCGGLSVRQWYKGMAAIGLLAAGAYSDYTDLAQRARNAADAALAEDRAFAKQQHQETPE